METMCELQLLSGTLVLLLKQGGGGGRARPAHLYALEPPADGPAPKHRTLYCSPLLLHNLQLHAACESAPLALDATQANSSLDRPMATVLVPRGACTEAAAALPRVASRVHVASVCVPAADPALSLGPPASGEARATAAALRRHFASTRFYSPGDLFVVPPRSWQALRTDGRQGTGRAGRGAAAADEARRRTAHESSASDDSDDDGAEHGAEPPRLFRVESIEHEEGGAVSPAAAGAARRGRGRGTCCWQTAAVREAVARRAAPEQPPERGLGSGLRVAVEVSPECGCASIVRGQTTLMQACAGMCMARAWHSHGTRMALAQHVHSMCTACAQHVHSMRTACAQHVHSLCVAHGAGMVQVWHRHGVGLA